MNISDHFMVYDSEGLGGFAEKAKIKTFPPLRDAMTRSGQTKTKWVGGPDAGVWLLVGIFLVLAVVVSVVSPQKMMADKRSAQCFRADA